MHRLSITGVLSSCHSTHARRCHYQVKARRPERTRPGPHPHTMAVELSLSEAMAQWQHLGDVVRTAGPWPANLPTPLVPVCYSQKSQNRDLVD